MNKYSVLFSHPDYSLEDHLCGVLTNCRILSETLQLSNDIRQAIDFCAILHDFGKASSYFQDYIRMDDHDRHRLTKDERMLKSHACFSAMWTFIITKQQLNNESVAIVAYFAVLKHHGNLSNAQDMLFKAATDLDLMKSISESIDYTAMNSIVRRLGFNFTGITHERFINECDKTFQLGFVLANENFGRDGTLDDYFNLNLLYSILLSADKGEAIFKCTPYRRTSNSLPANAVDRYKQKHFDGKPSGLNILREYVYQAVNRQILEHSDKRFLSINVPTGIGKTLTVLNAAFKLKAVRLDLHKIIYCLPFTSVIDQNAAVFTSVLANCIEGEPSSDHLMLYHYLAERVYRPADHLVEIDNQRAEFLLESFESDLSLTTFYQLLHGLLSGRNHEVRKLCSFANSIVILDEVQSIPIKYWPLVRRIFIELSERLNVTTILVTATMPLIFSEKKGEVVELVADKADIFKKMDRIDLNCSLLKKPFSIESFAEHLASEIEANSKQSVLVIVNTRRMARTLYTELNSRLGFSKVKQPDGLYCLSTDIYPKERLRRIQLIKQRTEEDNRGTKTNRPTIVISTQLVEAGVDLDFDIVWRDIAPLDSIFQACGRCNRNMRKGFRGQVRLVELLDDNGSSPASFLYGPYLISQTRELLQNQPPIIPEAAFFKLSQTYSCTLNLGVNKFESLSILEAMTKLNYDTAFNLDFCKSARKKGVLPAKHKPFSLIDENNTTPIFIASQDPEALHLLNEFQQLQNNRTMNRFARRSAIKTLNRQLGQFIVHVPENKVPKQNRWQTFLVDENINCISYDTETGIYYE